MSTVTDHGPVTVVLVPLVLLGPAMALAAVVLGLAAQGPLGALAALGLVAAVAVGARWSWRRCCRWWASTKAPERPPVPARPRPLVTGSPASSGPAAHRRPAR